jgi:hypothetical protein
LSETSTIVFSLFPRSADPMLATWRSFCAEVVAAGQRAVLTTGTTGTAPDVAGARRDDDRPFAGAQRDDDRPFAGARRPDERPLAEGRTLGIWRLLATNNREIARSAHEYTSRVEALAEVTRICDHADDLIAIPVVGVQRANRGWVATLYGETVMTGSRWYESTSTSTGASADALQALRTAVVSDSVRVIVPAGSRGRSTASLHATMASVW